MLVSDMENLLRPIPTSSCCLRLREKLFIVVARNGKKNFNCSLEEMPSGPAFINSFNPKFTSLLLFKFRFVFVASRRQETFLEQNSRNKIQPSREKLTVHYSNFAARNSK